jgi:hypothetical protein
MLIEKSGHQQGLKKYHNEARCKWNANAAPGTGFGEMFRGITDDAA